MNSTPLTRLAILGTISDLHRQPLPYDLACLSKIVTEQAPDLLCAEVTTDVWEQGNLAAAELEVREALAPVAALTDIVLVPVAPSEKQYAEFTSNAGWRQRATQSGIRVLRWGQRKAATPEAIHGFFFEAFCHTLCALTEATWTPEQRDDWDRQNLQMVENILDVVRRDPGRRVLVVVQCQRLHRLTPLLKAHSNEVELVHYQKL
jgi:hypothetical protein